MTIFKSRQVNLDPEPWRVDFVDGTSERNPTMTPPATIFDPRPEFEPTRDSEPWLDPITKGDGEREVRWATVDQSQRSWYEWAPRREQFDTPVNPILAAFRAQDIDTADDFLWEVNRLDGLRLEAQAAQRYYHGPRWTPAEIDHARRVLTRLYNWKEQ